MEENQKLTGNAPGPSSEECYDVPPYEIESAAYKFAKIELELLCEMLPTKDNPPIVKDFIHEILALVNRFGHSGQSGGSAPFVAASLASTIKKLCMFESLAPITGEDWEWSDAGGDEKQTVQNKRCYPLFKYGTGDIRYFNAIIWKTQRGGTWHSNSVKLPSGGTIGCSHKIKMFPFTPKTFTIDVIETEISKDNWEFTVKDESQLKEVFEYYDRHSK